MWVVLFCLAVGALVVIAVLGNPLAALLGWLVLLSAAGFASLFGHFVWVRQLTAQVVQSRMHDAVLRVVPGPGRTLLRPFYEKLGPVLDTGYRVEQVYVQDVHQPAQRANPLRFTVFVLHQLVPHTIPVERLGQILPHLSDHLSALIQRDTDYCLRILVADMASARLQNGGRQRLEHRLSFVLRDRLQNLGIFVHGVQLVIWPPAGLHETLTLAEQHRVGIALEAEHLGSVLGALTDRNEQARSLALLELARSLDASGRSWTTVDLASLWNTIGQGRSSRLASQKSPFSELEYPFADSRAHSE
jgi:hypothetical protein